MSTLSGQAALITGGGSGIGLQCARFLLRDGATVTIAGRTEARLRDAAAALEVEAPEGASVQWVVCDVADEEQVRAAVDVAAAPRDGLHLAVAAAGRGGLGPILTTSVEEWEGILATNTTGTFLTFKHAGAAISASGGGAMVAISSIAGVVTHRFMGPYCVSKAAIDMLVRVTADELGVAGVRVNSVQPGLVDTDLVSFVVGDEQTRTDYLDQMPVRRIGTVDDVAALVRFLLGPESSWITGATINVDGGHHLRRGPNYEPVARALFGDDAVEGRVPRG
ncbi:MAG: SDR family oxidoreductase [Acidimicrobiales bacterium]|jgi:NAD(P)-dependent dehydrogenase (short-subunit alcohol dehydrogenase family)